MFELTGKTPHTLDVGARNVQKVKELLQTENIPLISEDVGQNYGRTIKFNLNTFVLNIKLGLKRTGVEVVDVLLHNNCVAERFTHKGNRFRRYFFRAIGAIELHPYPPVE